MIMKRQLLMIINEDRFFLSHRKPIAVEAAAKGWDLNKIKKNTGRRKEIEDLGFQYIELPMNPIGMNLLEEFKTFWFLYKLYRKYPDAVIHQVGLKNMVWGGIASRLTRTRGVVYAVSGLGILFGENSSNLLSKILLRILRFGMHKRNVRVIFQNKDDEGLFLKNKIVREEDIYFTKGSGIDLDEFSYTPPSCEYPLRIIFTGRMLAEKGVGDVIKAAGILRKEYEGKIEFWLCGGLSDNPHAMTEEEINRLVDGKYIKWLGYRTDICNLLKESAIMCFPSYYREGVPKSLIEASAIGRPIVTTDSIGCRDTVENGKNGFIVPVHSPESLAQALKSIIEDKNMRIEMGKESRRIAERDYDINDVVSTHIEIYDSLYERKRK